MNRSRRSLGILAALGALCATWSCNNPYDLLLHDRFEQAEFNSKVDIVWVIDSSNSMSEIQEEIREEIDLNALDPALVRGVEVDRVVIEGDLNRKRILRAQPEPARKPRPRSRQRYCSRAQTPRVAHRAHRV